MWLSGHRHRSIAPVKTKQSSIGFGGGKYPRWRECRVSLWSERKTQKAFVLESCCEKPLPRCRRGKNRNLNREASTMSASGSMARRPGFRAVWKFPAEHQIGSGETFEDIAFEDIALDVAVPIGKRDVYIRSAGSVSGHGFGSSVTIAARSSDAHRVRRILSGNKLLELSGTRQQRNGANKCERERPTRSRESVRYLNVPPVVR